jgi:hypothetical protein
MTLQTSRTWKDFATDIRIWLGVFFVVRLIGITNPPLDPATTIRQCDVLMVARNFYEIDPNIFFPRIDIAGRAQLVGVEFPVYNYLIYCVSVVFGYDHWYGRIINLVLVTIALWCFYKMLSRFFEKEIAFNTTLIFLFSSWFAYARVTLPDIFGASLCIIALYMAFRYFENGRWLDFAIFIALACLGCLSKISAASLLSVLVIPVLDRSLLFKRKLMIVAAGAFTLAIVVAWYYVWVPHLNSIGYPNYFFMGIPMSVGFREVLEAPLKFTKRIFVDPLMYVGGTLVVGSLIYTARKKKFLALFAFLIPFLTFCVFILKSGHAFCYNGYYFLMLVPMMAFIAGFGLSSFSNKYVQFILLSAIAIENIANQTHIFESGPPYNKFVQLEPIFDSIGSEQSDRIVIANPDYYPMAMYMSHRKAWNYRYEHLMDAEKVNALKTAGCKYILVLKKIYGDLEVPYERVFASEDFVIYKL